MSKFSNIEKMLAMMNSQHPEDHYDVLVEAKDGGYRARIVLASDVGIPLFHPEHDDKGDLPSLSCSGLTMFHSLANLEITCQLTGVPC